MSNILKRTQSVISVGDASRPETAEQNKGNVKVLCRFRPLNQKEQDTGLIQNLEFCEDRKTVRMMINESGPGTSNHRFAYDYVFRPEDSQGLIYEKSAKPIIESVLEGFNGTVFAYG
jgi:hypothetical protein